MFASLDFVYVPSRDVAAEARHLVDVLGAEHLWSIERFDTRVARLRLSPTPPAMVLAEHLAGERPYLVHRVDDLETAMTELEARGWEREPIGGFPYGPLCAFTVAGGHRFAIYERTRPEMDEQLAGRFDF
jgi:hypothetical protein